VLTEVNREAKYLSLVYGIFAHCFWGISQTSSSSHDAAFDLCHPSDQLKTDTSVIEDRGSRVRSRMRPRIAHGMESPRQAELWIRQADFYP
jgi:hypothetical protein